MNVVRISFPLNVERKNKRILIEICICIDIDIIQFGIVKRQFSFIHYKVTALE